MNWIVGIILLGIVIGIARAYPKTSILIAIVLFFIYINNDKEYASEKKINKTELRQNTNTSNRIQPDINYYRSNNYESKRINNYSPAINSPSKSKSNTLKIRIGAVCKDGTTSRATGRGACSHHGGVDYWLYE